jgi:hypothetical protein
VVLAINPLHSMYQLDWFRELIYNHHSITISSLLLIVAFLSIVGIKCDILMFRGKNRHSREVFMLLFYGDLRKAL